MNYKRSFPSETYLRLPKIYYLAFDNVPFYIGCTTMPLIKRLTDTRNDSRTNTGRKDVFIAEMLDRNKSLQIELIEIVEDSKRSGLIEEYWLHQFMAWGFTMYNSHLSVPPKRRDKRGLKRYIKAGIPV